ncbi:uncharacterized protein EI97DRAFT_450633 [Westerdykella ornata]|uniref:Cytochrome b561 domain-containing protein n=1 Tax=Westerdykella ornata TaxID=318751 RepID=A0A6A6JHV7_WESOR|nr:uncharacterized protein EI97DRAFT_450633 [Westerdykella ornata]KAF2275805.1 hypothetical protein EI97DRAFT_450633 [Westerdykella ornata]
MSTDDLSPPGSGSYTSGTMHVGDGTWDSQRNVFLLPNLQGYNLATTQYNGMGNRFRGLSGYRSMIMGHGILAGITFLLIVPAAILLARFYHRNPRMALRYHIWLQILTVLLSTALFVLGFQAVGSERSLSNPHHGIGVALYTLILTQAFAGCVIHRREKGKERFKVPLKLMLHQWMGRAIAMLGIVQVALGLTLYGSSKILFILYAVWCFGLLLVYFILSYKNQPEMAFDDRGTYITERTESSRGHRGHGLGKLAAAGAAGAGLAALARKRSRSRSGSRSHGGRHGVVRSRHSSRLSDSYAADEKYTEDGRQRGTWKDRLFGAAAVGGGIFALRSLFNRNKKHATTESGSEVSYSRPIGPSEVTQTDLSRLEEGRAPTSPGNDRWRRVEEREAAQASAMTGSPLRHGHRPRRSGESIASFDSRTSFDDDHGRPTEESHTLRNGIAALGLAGYLKYQWNKRRNRKEDAHVEAMRRQDIEEERAARANSQRRRYTGDGIGPPRRNRPPSTIISETDVTGTTPAMSRPPIPPPPSNIPPPPKHSAAAVATSGPSNAAPSGGVLSESGSETYTSPGGGHHRRHHLAAPGAGGPGRDSSRHSGEGSVASPPVSVKVKMHNDGRHITLRRLNEEEAAAEREARRERQRRNRNGSVSSLSNVDNDRWRRTEALEAQQAVEMQQSQAPAPPRAPATAPVPMPEPVIPGPPPGPPPVPAQPTPLPPPPPIPAGGGSILSSPPGTQIYGTETDVSNYDSNRRRRRAERAQAKQARQSGSRVEFS